MPGQAENYAKDAKVRLNIYQTWASSHAAGLHKVRPF